MKSTCTCGLHNKDDAVQRAEVRKGGGGKILPAQTVLHPLVGNQTRQTWCITTKLSTSPCVIRLLLGCLVCHSHPSQTHGHQQMLDGNSACHSEGGGT